MENKKLLINKMRLEIKERKDIKAHKEVFIDGVLLIFFIVIGSVALTLVCLRVSPEGRDANAKAVKAQAVDNDMNWVEAVRSIKK